MKKKRENRNLETSYHLTKNQEHVYFFCEQRNQPTVTDPGPHVRLGVRKVCWAPHRNSRSERVWDNVVCCSSLLSPFSLSPTGVMRFDIFEAIKTAYTNTTLLQCLANRKSRKGSLQRPKHPKHPLNTQLQGNSCDPTPPSPTILLLLHLASADQSFILMSHRGNRNIPAERREIRRERESVVIPLNQ